LDMDIRDFADWVFGDTSCIDVMFHYDYRANKASILITEGNDAVRKLIESIPGFGDALRAINGTREKG